MLNLESAIHWRQWSVGIVLVLFIALFSLTQFGLLAYSSVIIAGCVVLLLSLLWNIYVLKLAQSRSKPGWNSEIADGLLITGLILVFFGAFF
jgi:hypothetical protein